MARDWDMQARMDGSQRVARTPAERERLRLRRKLRAAGVLAAHTRHILQRAAPPTTDHGSVALAASRQQRDVARERPGGSIGCGARCLVEPTEAPPNKASDAHNLQPRDHPKEHPASGRARTDWRGGGFRIRPPTYPSTTTGAADEDEATAASAAHGAAAGGRRAFEAQLSPARRRLGRAFEWAAFMHAADEARHERLTKTSGAAGAATAAAASGSPQELPPSPGGPTIRAAQGAAGLPAVVDTAAMYTQGLAPRGAGHVATHRHQQQQSHVANGVTEGVQLTLSQWLES